jgi:haloalkane dehalogenase
MWADAGDVERVNVDGQLIAYRELGTGDPIVLLHGNPTSSYLWRNVLPHLAGLGRCIALDLVGMGASAKLPDSGPGKYRFAEHRHFVAAALAALGVAERVILVGHDWGGVLAVDWARAHESGVRAIAYLETLVAPVSSDSPNAPDPAVFDRLRGPDGERLVLEENFFVEHVLPGGTMRRLRTDELDAYRAPFAEHGESRRPTLSWAREIPIDGFPADVHRVVAENAAWMGRTSVPKLFISGEPGALLTGPLRELCRRWPNQREVTVPGLHFLPEDAPDAIGSSLAAWIRELP